MGATTRRYSFSLGYITCFRGERRFGRCSKCFPVHSLYRNREGRLLSSSALIRESLRQNQVATYLSLNCILTEPALALFWNPLRSAGSLFNCFADCVIVMLKE